MGAEYCLGGVRPLVPIYTSVPLVISVKKNYFCLIPCIICTNKAVPAPSGELYLRQPVAHFEFCALCVYGLSVMKLTYFFFRLCSTATEYKKIQHNVSGHRRPVLSQLLYESARVQLDGSSILNSRR